MLGFDMPSPEIIAHSVTGATVALPQAGPIWSHWLIGCVVTWGCCHACWRYWAAWYWHGGGWAHIHWT
ncbi:hypothetical protein N7E01_09760 [Neopusillimonas aromaticivorans]|nr:DUF2868 domain-containing protein [Neopusillimonas aromaticivorans]WJJ95032.1 hypothetical protein N7E01_09760 [Neopusillimonas aromaticivorans]